MDRKFIFLLLTTVFVLSFTVVSYSQGANNKWGFGFDLGGQRLYGDKSNVGIGIGAEGLVKYKIMKFASLSFGLGFSQLKYALTTGNNTTDMFNADIKGNFEIISKGILRPYLTLGVGLLNINVANSVGGRFWEEALFGGGGLLFKINDQFDGLISADYRFTSGDALDNTQNPGSANDGYLNVRAGMIYNLATNGNFYPDIIASERVPFTEVSDESQFTNKQKLFPAYSDQESKNMEEYVKLKSRIDALYQRVDTKENEIEKLQNSLLERKKYLSSLENRAENLPVVNIEKISSMSGFSEIYEAALANYYNKNHSEAISLLKLLLQQYPNHSLAGNCQFWIGQSLFALNRFEEAINAFSKVLNYSRSLKKDDSLYLLGKSYLNLGFGEKAKESFSLLIREYPKSEFVQSAQDYIRKL